MAMESELSVLAARCRDQRLPGLLAAVRRRRLGRRRAQLAIVVAFAAALPAAWWWGQRSTGIAATEAPLLASAEPQSASAVVHDDPTVLDRCVVSAIDRDAWYLDDQSLQQLLQQAGLDSGLIRAGGRLLAVAAIEALPPAP